MATRKRSKMFGEDLPVQRNKETPPYAEKPNRSPGESNATKYRPSVYEDVGKSTKNDVGRVVKAVSEPAKTKLGQEARNQAAVRAGSRLVSRAGLVGAAASAGYDVGTAINDKYKVSDKLVEGAESYGDKVRNTVEHVKASVKDLVDVNSHKWKGMLR